MDSIEREFELELAQEQEYLAELELQQQLEAEAEAELAHQQQQQQQPKQTNNNTKSIPLNGKPANFISPTSADNDAIAISQSELSELDSALAFNAATAAKRKLPFTAANNNNSVNTSLVDDLSVSDTNSTLQQISAATASIAKKQKLIADTGSGVINSNNNTVSTVISQPIYVYSRAPINGEYITVTDINGNRVYLTQLTSTAVNNRISTVMKTSRKNVSAQCLSAPINIMLAELERIELELAIKQSTAAAAAAESTIIEQPATNHLIQSQLWVDKYRPSIFTDLLSPERLNREVLSWIKEWDQCVYGKKKTVLQLQQKLNKNSMLSNSYLHKQQNGNNSKSNNNKSTDNNNPGGSIDPYGRPDHKVLLLCGPPGLGKTTLIHLLAKHAGYNPVEINASDDRSESILIQKVRSTVEMQSVFTSGKSGKVNRPNLLILDEIDGASNSNSGGDSGEDRSAINALVKVIQAERKEKKGKSAVVEEDENTDPTAAGDDEDNDTTAVESTATNNNDSANNPINTDSLTKSNKKGGGGSKPKDTIPPLRRPIIAICNDQYVPALRPLRSIAKILVIDQPLKSRLVDRLKYICNAENMIVDERILSYLCDLVNNDIRSALNTLQFIHSKKEKLTMKLLSNIPIGQKDVNQSRIELLEQLLWNKISGLSNSLQQQQQQQLNKDNAINNKNNPNANTVNITTNLATTTNTKFNRLWNNLSDSIYSDSNKLIELLSNNYLQQSSQLNDPNFSNIVELSNLFSIVDYCDNIGINNQSGELMLFNQYLPYIPYQLSLILNANKSAKSRSIRNIIPLDLNSNLNYHNKLLLDNNINILSLFLSDDNLLKLNGYNNRLIVIDLLSYLLDILSPSIRPVNFQLLTINEKTELEQLMDTLIQLKLTFKQDNNSHNTPFNHYQSAQSKDPIFILEPPIDTLSTFNINIDKSPATTTAAGSHYNKSTHNSNNNNIIAQKSIHQLERELPNKVKQLLVHELEFELIRRQENKRKQYDTDTTAQNLLLSPSTTVNNNNSKSTPNTISPHSAGPINKPFTKPDSTVELARKTAEAAAAIKLEAAATATANAAVIDPTVSPKRRTNFLQDFSNKIKTNQTVKRNINNSSSSTADSNSNTSNPVLIHFKFNEGFTQAVRRTVYVSHFI